MGRFIWFSQILCLCFFLLHYQVECSSLSQSFSNTPPHLCRPEEQFALLDFKTTTISVRDCYPAHLTAQTWNGSIDCCLWEGITCNNMTGHVIGLDISESCIAANLTTNSSLFRLRKLQSLNLKDAGLTKSTFLFEIYLLPKLVSLDLSYNHDLLVDQPKFQMLVHNLTKLRRLILDFVDMSLVVPSSLLNLTSSMEQLSLRGSSLQGNFPSQAFHLPSLQLLDLSENINLRGHLPKSNWSSPLKYLDLHITSFSGELPHSLGNLKLLEKLTLHDCLFYGPIPRSLANLSELNNLILYGNHLEGQIPNVFGKLHKLSSLALQENNFSGEVPTSISNLTNLAYFILSNNKINGSIPCSLFDLVNLIVVDLSSNNLTGTITATMLSKLVNLESLDVSKNSLLSLSSNGTSVNYTFPSLGELRFSSCNIQKFLSFLTKARALGILDISNNNISGQIHKWELGEMSLYMLNLSYNSLAGIEQFASDIVSIVDLRSNLIQGSLPIPSASWDFIHLYLSGNNLTGEIPSTLCNFTFLRVIDLANNSLGGKIPECLANFHDLTVLDLRKNKFHGRIPNSFVNLLKLRTLNLNDNKLEGILPASLVNCNSLEVLDVGNNYLNDTFPYWLGVLSSLQVLVLRSNRFHGPINNSMPAFYFPQLRIIDVSHNDFMGLLPNNYFKNLKAMKDVHLEKFNDMYIGNDMHLGGFFGYYEDSVVVIIKDQVVELERILKTLTSIDFSSNRFHGEIPQELGELNSLHLLNLSHNSLTGQISSSLGKITELESLDLASNKIEGRIPEQLTSLTFLSILNLSHNQLMGHIPEGRQFNTFSNDSYIGNSGLCGLLLTKKCSEQPESPPSKFEEDSAALFDWKIALMGYGSGLVLGFSVGYIVFTTGKPWWLVKKVEVYQQKFVGRCNRRQKKRKNQQPNRRSDALRSPFDN